MSGAIYDTDPSTKRLFEVVLVMNGGRQIKTEAFFWASTPSVANQHAVQLWKQYHVDPFGSQNIDGSETEEGFCHESFGIYGHGSMSMNVVVQYVDQPCGSWGINVLKRVLKSRSLNAKGSKPELQMRLVDYVDKTWKRPLYKHEQEATIAATAADAKANPKKRPAEQTDSTYAKKSATSSTVTSR